MGQIYYLALETDHGLGLGQLHLRGLVMVICVSPSTFLREQFLFVLTA